MVETYGVHRTVNGFLWVVALVVLFDQIAKYFVQTYLTDMSIIPGVLHFTKAANTGAAFSLFQNSVTVLSIISIIVIIILTVVVFLRKTEYPLLIGLVVGGALGNVIDRIFRGYVVDFINLGWWPVFNIADSAVVIGVVLILIREFFKKRVFSEESKKKLFKKNK